MAERAAKTPILVVQFWVCDLKRIKAALASAGLDVELVRVDFEAALHAALTWQRPAVVLYDPSTQAISRAMLGEAMRMVRCDVPVIEIDELATLGERVHACLRARRS